MVGGGNAKSLMHPAAPKCSEFATTGALRVLGIGGDTHRFPKFAQVYGSRVMQGLVAFHMLPHAAITRSQLAGAGRARGRRVNSVETSSERLSLESPRLTTSCKR